MDISQWGYLDTDNRRLVTVNFFGSWFRDDVRISRLGHERRHHGTRRHRVDGQSADSNTARNHSMTQWVDNLEDEAGTHYVFGRIDQTTVGISLRANYTMHPTLTLQIYARPFVSAGAYSDFKELVDGRAPVDDDRYRPFAYAGDPNFNFLSLRTTNVLRWEYRPGSALFVVWQQGREDELSDGAFRLGRDLGGAFDAPASNTVLIKISRWLNF